MKCMKAWEVGDLLAAFNVDPTNWALDTFAFEGGFGNTI